MTDQVNLNECKHCSGTGTCSTVDGKSCGKCIQEAKLKTLTSFFSNNNNIGDTGLVCGVCDGLGQAQTKTNKINSRARFSLALWITLPVLIIAVILKDSSNFPAYLTFAGTLIASITGFYFAHRDDN